MNTKQVETFEVVEVDALTGEPESDTEAMALIESLGLEGQKKLYGKKGDAEVVRMPYRKMSVAEKFVYETLLTEKTPLERYESGGIPLRVLQVASHAKPLFAHLYVWHTADKRDPLLVGASSDYASDQFILARWDDVLESFEALSKRAVKRFRDEYKAKIVDITNKLNVAVATVNATPDSVLIEGGKRIPTFYE